MRDETPLSPDLLLQAYRIGLFPMSESQHDPEIFWVNPKRRGLLPLDGFHISRSLARTMRRNVFTLTANTAFDAVVGGCAARESTWINGTIRDLYRALHDRGDAHSVEVWSDGALAGGVYGVSIGGAFFGESMFSRRTDASKVALACLVDRLRTRGFALFDTQFLTDHLARLGGIEVPQDRYIRALDQAVRIHADFGPPGPMPSTQEVVQRSTQTS